ncbi:MAG: InlB B-repeat-containing protein, partial [Ruminiclostridium sp.]
KVGTKQAVYTAVFSAGENGTLAASVEGTAINTGATVLKGKDIVFTASPAGDYRVKEWTVNGTTVAGNKTTTLTVSNIQASKVVTVAFEQILDVIDYPVTHQRIVNALDKATDKLIEKFDDSNFNYQKHWMAIAINGDDKAVPGSYLQEIKNGDMPAANSGQYGKYILGILAAGGDPTNINGRNLMSELCQLRDMKNVNTEGGIYTTPFGLLALDAVNYEIPANAGFTRDELINKLITLASPTGGEDGIGFVLTALGKYYNEKPAVKTAIDNVVSAWANRQGEDGGFGAGGWSPYSNVNTSAQVLMGLSFNGKDPQSEQFTKAKGNLVSFILSLQNEDGTFNWQKADPGSVSMATEQSVYALAQYLRQLDGRKSIYDFTPTASDTIAPVISTDLADKTVNTSNFTFTASASDTVDGVVVPVVKLGDKTVALMNGAYRVTLSEGPNTITVTAADSSGNKSEKSFTIAYAAKAQEIPIGDKPKVEIPSDNNDYKIPITSEDSNKEITIEISGNNTAKVLVELPLNCNLPEIAAVKGNVTVLFPKGIQVKSGNAAGIELITSKDTT